MGNSPPRSPGPLSPSQLRRSQRDSPSSSSTSSSSSSRHTPDRRTTSSAFPPRDHAFLLSSSLLPPDPQQGPDAEEDSSRDYKSFTASSFWPHAGVRGEIRVPVRQPSLPSASSQQHQQQLIQQQQNQQLLSQQEVNHQRRNKQHHLNVDVWQVVREVPFSATPSAACELTELVSASHLVRVSAQRHQMLLHETVFDEKRMLVASFDGRHYWMLLAEDLDRQDFAGDPLPVARRLFLPMLQGPAEPQLLARQSLRRHRASAIGTLQLHAPRTSRGVLVRIEDPRLGQARREAGESEAAAKEALRNAEEKLAEAREMRQRDAEDAERAKVQQRSEYEAQMGQLVAEKVQLENEKTNLLNEKVQLENEKTQLENEKTNLLNQKVQLENEKTQLENEKSNWENERTQLENEKTQLENENHTMHAQSQQLQDANAQLASELAALEAERLQQAQQHEEALRLLTARLEGLQSSSAAQQSAAESRAQQSEARLHSLEQSLHAQTQRADDLQGQLGEMQSSKAALQAELDGMQTSKDALHSEFNALQISKDSLQSSLDALQTSKDALQSSLDALQTSKDALQSSLDALQSSKDALQSECSDLQQQRAALESSVSILEATLLERDGQLSALRAQVEAGEAETCRVALALEDAKARWSKDADLLNQQLDHANSENHALSKKGQSLLGELVASQEKIEALSEQIEELTQDANGLTEALVRANQLTEAQLEELTDLRAQSSVVQAGVAQESAQLRRAHQQQLEALRGQISELEVQHGIQAQTIEQLQGQLGRKEQISGEISAAAQASQCELLALKGSLAERERELQAQLKAALETAGAHEQAVAQRDEAIAVLNQRVSELEATNASLLAQIEQLQRALQEQQERQAAESDAKEQRIKGLESAVAQSTIDLEQSNQKLEQSQIELEQSNQKLEQSNQKLEQSQLELEQSNQKLEQSQLELEQSQIELEQSQLELEQSNQKLEQSQLELEQSNQALKQSTSEINSSTSSSSSSASTLDATSPPSRNIPEDLKHTYALLKKDADLTHQIKPQFEAQQTALQQATTQWTIVLASSDELHGQFQALLGKLQQEFLDWQMQSKLFSPLEKHALNFQSDAALLRPQLDDAGQWLSDLQLRTDAISQELASIEGVGTLVGKDSSVEAAVQQKQALLQSLEAVHQQAAAILARKTPEGDDLATLEQCQGENQAGLASLVQRHNGVKTELKKLVDGKGGDVAVQFSAIQGSQEALRGEILACLKEATAMFERCTGYFAEYEKLSAAKHELKLAMEEFNAANGLVDHSEDPEALQRREEAKGKLTRKMDALLALLAWADAQREGMQGDLQESHRMLQALGELLEEFHAGQGRGGQLMAQFSGFLEDTASARHRNDGVSNQIRKQLRRFRDILEFEKARLAELELLKGQLPSQGDAQGDDGDDLVHKMITEYLRRQKGDPIPPNFQRLSEGVYQFGTRKIHATLLPGGFLVVRVGGGYMNFEEFVRKFGKFESVKIIKQQGGPRTATLVAGSGTFNIVPGGAKDGKESSRSPARPASVRAPSSSGSYPSASHRVRSLTKPLPQSSSEMLAPAPAESSKPASRSTAPHLEL